MRIPTYNITLSIKSVQLNKEKANIYLLTSYLAIILELKLNRATKL